MIMPESSIKEEIAKAAFLFAMRIVDMIRNATVEDLNAFISKNTHRQMVTRRYRKPGSKAVAVTEKKVDGRKNRIVKNYPKCVYPGCNNNRFPRGEGYCGEHWRLWKAGKIKAPSEYKKKAK